MERNPKYALKEAISLIMRSGTMEEIETIKCFLMQEIAFYPLAEQGFLMTMMGIQIIILEEGRENFDRFVRECLLSLLRN